ncbi:MAG TPA: beta-ketoacyl-ACP synthase III [Chloroflexota bacterium]
MSRWYARIAGWGCYIPSRVLTNHDLERMVDTSDEWIRTRSGIVERRIADEEETTAYMGGRAAAAALARAGVAADEVDLILVATCTGDYPGFPSTACLVQERLGARNAGACDVGAACSGFIYGLVMGSQFVATGACRNVLVVGAERMSRIIDWTDRATCVLFGDGAGAVLLQPTDQPGGLLSFVLGADGSGGCHLLIPAGGTTRPASHETVEERMHFVRMNGREVYRFATTIVPDALVRAVQQAGLQPSQVDLLIPHQANSRIIDAAARRLELPEERVVVNIDRYGNTSAASIPVALCEALEDGRVRSGSRLAMVGFGAGLTWAAAVWQWH